VPQQGGGIVGHPFVGDGAVDVGRVPVPLQLDGDDLPGLGEGRHYLSHRIDRHVGAVEHDQRSARAMYLVLHLKAVHGSVVASS